MSHEPTLAALLLNWEELMAQGKAPSAEELCRDCPELAPTLDRRIQVMKRWNAAREDLGSQTTGTGAGRAADTGQALPQVPGYEVLEKIGGGGMGVVYKARQIKLDRLVALKMILAGGHAGATDLARFRTEAEAIARVKHPGIVEVHDFGTHGGLPFFALELPCSGGNLADRLSGTPLPGREAARIVEQLSRAMHAAHEAGVIHRDLKPANVLVSDSGAFKITDFGLAKRLEGGSGLTQTDQVMGTPSYMAPEQALGQKDVGPAADVYALGTILYECLTGRPPFKAATPLDTIRQVIDDEPVPPSRLQPKVPRDLETICLKCLRKEPGKRYVSAGELADDLERFLADRPIHARRNSSTERAWRWCRRNPVVASLSAAVLLLLSVTAVGGVVMSLRLAKAVGEARSAEREGKRKLFASYVSEADAIRMSRRSGQRFGTLRRVHDALEIAGEIGLHNEDRLRLRNIAIAALCLPDIESGSEWAVALGDPLPEDMSPLFRRLVVADNIVRRLPQPAYALHGNSWFSPDGRFVAVGTRPYKNTVAVPARVWRIDGTSPVLVVEDSNLVHEEAIGFQKDGQQVAFGYLDGAVSIYDLERRKLVERLVPAPGPVKCLVYHPHLPRLAVARGSEVAIWGLGNKQRLVRLQHPTRVTGVAWHPRGHRLVTASADRNIRLWDTETGRLVTAPWQGHKIDGIRLTFNHAGDRVASNDWGLVMRLWDSATGQLLLSSPHRTYPHFSSDDRMLVSSWTSKKLEGLRVAGGQEMRSLRRPTPKGDEAFVNASIHPNGRLLVVKTNTGLGLFDLRTGEEAGFVAGNFGPHIRFDTTGAVWTAGAAGLLRWPVRPEPTFPSRLRVGPPNWVADVLHNGQTGFSLSEDGAVVAVPRDSEGGLVVHRDTPRRTFRLGPQQDVRALDVSPDGQRVLTGSHHWLADHRYKLWEAGTGRLVATLPYPDIKEVYGFSRDSRWLYVSGKEEGRLEVASLAAAHARPKAAAAVPGAPSSQEGWRNEPMRVGGSLSPDTHLAAFGRKDGSIQIVRAKSQEAVASLSSPETGRLMPWGFSPDGTLLLACGEHTGTMYVFDLRRIREQLAELGLDWELPSYPPARPDELNPILAPPLRVELIDAEAASSLAKMAKYESQHAVARLFFNPFDAGAHYRLGARLLGAGKPGPAYAHLSTALALWPGLDEVLYPQTQAAFQLRRWAGVVNHASRCLEKCPFDSNARSLRAQAYAARKCYKEALPDISAVLATYPGYAQGYALRGRCYAALGKLALAKADREQAIKLGDKSPAATE